MPTRVLAALVLALLIACNTPPTAPSEPAGIELVSGGDQQGVAGYPLPQPVVVRVVDDRGDPLPNIELSVTVSAPLAKATADSWVTDENGEVSLVWQMGASVDGEALTIAAPEVPSLDALTIAARGGSRALRAISGGLTRYCAVTLDQRLGCWNPMLNGFPPTVPAQAPAITFRPPGEQFLDVALGVPSYGLPAPMAGCAIRSNGNVACFNDTEGLGSLADLGGTHPPFVQVFANHHINSRFFCALAQDGEAWCWGRNSGGQLGNGTTADAPQPTPVDGTVRFTSLALGETHACGLDAEGAAWCWGRSHVGATGTGSFGITLLTPTAVATPTRFVELQVIAGVATCGKSAQAAWWCWGHALYSTHEDETAVPQVANFPAGARLATPDQVALASDPAGNAAWWGDLIPTLDLTIASDPRPVDITLSVISFLPKVRDRAACIDVDTHGRWLCIDLLFLASAFGGGWIPTKPLVHGVP